MLKWKLHNALQKRNAAAAGVATEFHWSQQSYTLQEIVQKFKLPCLVLCASDCNLDWNAFHFNLKQPLLLHSTRTALKATAHCLRRAEPSRQYEKIGTSVVIPEDYSGWFTLIGPSTDGSKHFENIREISESDVDEFLAVKAVIGKSINGERRVVSNGEILRKVDRIAATEVTVSNNFLLCKDEKDEEVIISLSHRGKFYKVSKDPECENSVFQMRDLLKGNLETPVYIRHVVGEIPMLTSAYSSLLELVSVTEETTILASTLDEKTMMPLELQTNSRIKFKISLNESRLRRSEPFSEAMEFCQTDGEGYMKGMKIAFQMSPETWLESNTSIASSNETLDLENITSSLGGFGAVGMEEESYYSDSDLGEEDAQSEFTFKWTNENEENRISKGNQATGVNDNRNSKNDMVKDRNRSNQKSKNGFVEEGSIPVTESDIVKNVNTLNIQNVAIKDMSDLNSGRAGFKKGDHLDSVNADVKERDGQNGTVKDGKNRSSQNDTVKDGENRSSQNGTFKDGKNRRSQNNTVKDGENRSSQNGTVKDGENRSSQNDTVKDGENRSSQNDTIKDGENRSSQSNVNVNNKSSPKSPRYIATEEKGIPKVFNSCIKSSRESVVWNEEPDIV